MNIFKFLWNTSTDATLRITLLSIINGLSGGLILIFFPDAAINMYTAENYLFYGTLLPVITVVFLVTRHFVQLKTEALASKAVEEMVMEVTNTVRHTELPKFQRFNQEDIFLSIADAQTISTAACKTMETFQSYLALLVGWLHIAFHISPFFGLLLLAARLIQILLQEMFGKIIFSYAREQQQEEKKFFAALQQQLYGFRDLKFNRKKSEDIFKNHLVPRIEGGKQKRVITRRYGAELLLTSLLVHLLTMVCCTSFSASLSPQDVAQVIIILLFVLQNDMLINSSMQNIAEGNAALQKLRLLFPQDTVRKTDEDIAVPIRQENESFQSIRFDEVGFSYPAQDDEQSFSININNLTIKAGEILFVVGGNGSGKSTFMNLLTGLYPPAHGMIERDGHLVPIEEYRDMFSTVFSNFHLFDKLYGIDSVDEEKVWELLCLTELEGKTRYREGSFTTQNLSAGQRKRLALVIALVEDRPIFVFDEWAADQDPHFRCFFYEEILPSLRAKGKTIIAATHDDRYFHRADKVIQMECGRIVEQWRPSQQQPNKSILFHQPTTTSNKKKDQKVPPVQDITLKENQEEKESRNNIFTQLFQLFQEDQAVTKKFFSYLFLFIFSLVTVTVNLLHAPMDEGLSVTRYIWFTLFLFLMVTAFRRLQQNYHQAVENRVAVLRIDVIEHTRNTDLLTLQKIGLGRIYTVLTSDIRTIASTFHILLLCFQGGMRMAMIYLYIAYLYPPAFLIMLIFSGLGALLYYFNHIKMVDVFLKVRDQEKKLFDAVRQLLDGFKELRLSSRKSNDFYHNSLIHNTARLRALRLDSMKYYTSNASITYGFWKSIMIIILFLLPWAGMAVPQHTLPVIIGLILTMPVRQVIDLYSQFHMAYLSIQNLFRFENRMKKMGQKPEEQIPSDELPRYHSVRYENISFTYQTQDDRPFSIAPLNISFSAGEIVFITGGNGSGKSTLLNLVTGLYPADSGKTFLNNGEAIDIRMYRELFGSIFTDFHLFDRLYGMEEVDEKKLKEQLIRFGLEKKVKWEKSKFNTLDLSTGQKKRLALIITIMEDKPIFVLDEWAADQDPQFREYFYMTLLPEFKAQGKTVIAVTHDDKYFHTADRVLHLEYGQLHHTATTPQS